ncbi:MAG TPA: hypothetical protein VF620_01640 [Allosphingosinicella sp.]|jgi:hypothetical protein
MKKLIFALAALAATAPAAATGEEVAPAVKLKPVAVVPAPQLGARTGSERDYQTALTAAAGRGGDGAALDGSLIRVMSRLLAAGQCREAVGVATRDGRKELAARAQQLCK